MRTLYFPRPFSYLFSVVALQLSTFHEKVNVVLVEHGDVTAACSVDVSLCFAGTPGYRYCCHRRRRRPTPTVARPTRALRAHDAVTTTGVDRVAMLVSIATDALPVVRVRRRPAHAVSVRRRGVLRVRGARRGFLCEGGRRRGTPYHIVRLLLPPFRLLLLLPQHGLIRP